MLIFDFLCANIIRLLRAITGCSADGSALEWGSRGRWFKSSHSDHKTGSRFSLLLVLLSRMIRTGGLLPSNTRRNGLNGACAGQENVCKKEYRVRNVCRCWPWISLFTENVLQRFRIMDFDSWRIVSYDSGRLKFFQFPMQRRT